jgi:uroporphyrin-III C-methyltransferase
LVTAHLRDQPLTLDWEALAGPDGTVGVYMGRAAAPHISHSLIAEGRDPDTPVLIAVNVSLSTERLISGKLSALHFLTEAISDDDPTLLLIGEALSAATTAVCITPDNSLVKKLHYEPDDLGR